MLIIHNSLGLGGIETFILRLVKQRYKEGLKTKILLIAKPSLNDDGLFSEVNKYASVYFINDFVFGVFPFYLNLSFKYNAKKFISLMHDLKSIHVTFGNALIVAEKILNATNIKLPISVGFYHSMEFCWGKGRILPYYERINRDVVFNKIPVSNLFLFSSSIIDFYKEYSLINLEGAATFRIGTVSVNHMINDKIMSRYDNFSIERRIKFCSVGRLVDFKKYNLWMLDIVSNLRDKGYNVQYDIYGRYTI